MVVKLRRKDLKDPELTRHGDSAVMLALLWFATMNLSAPIDYTAVPRQTNRWDALPGEVDDDTHGQAMAPGVKHFKFPAFWGVFPGGWLR